VVAANYNISSNVLADGSETSGASPSFQQAMLLGIACGSGLNPKQLNSFLDLCVLSSIIMFFLQFYLNLLWLSSTFIILPLKWTLN